MATQKSVSLTFTKENTDRFLCLQDELRVDGNGLLELLFKLYDDNKAKLNTLTNYSSSSGGSVTSGSGIVTSSSSGGGSVNISTSYSSDVIDNVDSNCSSRGSIGSGGDSGGCVLGLVNSASVENIHMENLDENLNEEPCEDPVILDEGQQGVGEPDLNEGPHEDPVKLDEGQDLAETGLCCSESFTDTQPQQPLDTATNTITPTIVAATTTTTSNSRTTTVNTTTINTTTTTSNTDNTTTTAANTTTSTTAAAITTTINVSAAATSLNSRTTTVNTTTTSSTTTTTTTTTAATTTAGTTTTTTTATATNSPDNTITTIAATTTCASTGLSSDHSQRVVDLESGETAELLISLKNIQNRDHNSSSSSSSSRRSWRRRSISTAGDNSRNYGEGDGRMIVKEEKLTGSVVEEDPADGFDASFSEPLHKVAGKERLSTESEVVAFPGRISSLEHTSEVSHMEVLASPIQVSSSDVVSNHCGQTSEEEKHIYEEEEEEEFSGAESVKYKREEEKEDRFPRQVSSSDVVDIVSGSSSFPLLPSQSNAAKSVVQVSDSCVQTSEEEADNDKHMYDHEEEEEEEGEFLVESVRCKEEEREDKGGREREGVVTAADDDCDDDVVIDETELKFPESVEPKLKRRNRVWLSRIQDADFEERHYKCSYCAAAFFHPHHLQRHVKQLHKSGKTAKPNQCRDCFKSFATLLTLKFHQDFACRMVRRPHRCTLCQLGFKSTEQVQKHKCSANPSKPLCCPQFQCDYRTGSPRDLEHHLRIHTGERCYKCELCDFRTAWKKNLKEHVLKHSGLKPFVCHVCNFASNDKSNLRSHLTKHSAEENHPKKTTTKKKNNNNSSSSGRCCHVCGCSFLDVRMFMQHMRTHSDDELHPFCKCPICPYLTRYKSSLKSHMRTHQNIGQQQQKITEEKVIEFGTNASNGASAGIFARAENCASVGNRGSAVIFASAVNADVSSSNVGNSSSSCNGSAATDAAGSITSSSSSRDVGNECEPMREVYVEATAVINENYCEQQKQYYMCEECSFMVDDRNAFDSHLCYSSSQEATALTQSTASFLDNGGMVIQIIEDHSQLTESSYN